MLRRRKIVSNGEKELIDKIKMELETELYKKGIHVSGMNLKLNSESISLNIFINGSKRLA
jgi:hypothetical protein